MNPLSFWVLFFGQLAKNNLIEKGRLWEDHLRHEVAAWMQATFRDPLFSFPLAFIWR